ncbi:MAG: carbonic anhydrase [Sarcina sp.]
MKKIAIGLLIISSLSLCACSTTKSSTNNATTPAPPATTANLNKNVTVDTTVTNSTDALNLLKQGNTRFVNNDSEVINVSSDRRNALVKSQNPFAVVVACSDSRVAPELIFNAGLGEIYDVRLAGNVVDDDAMGSIQYAINEFNTPLIVVVGHENCGAVTAAYDSVMKNQPAAGYMTTIVDEIKPAITANETVNDAINKNIANMVNVIKLNSSIKEKITAGKLDVIGAYYNLDGTVTFYEGKTTNPAVTNPTTDPNTNPTSKS